MIEAGRYSDVSVGNRETAGRIVPPPADARQIDFGPGMHIRILAASGRAFISADKSGCDSHHSATIAE